MTFNNTETGFGLISKLLHWGVVFLFVCQFVLAGTMEDLAKDGTAFGLSKFGLYDLHKSFGVLILLLGIFRIYWRWKGVLPLWKEALSGIEEKIVHLTERGLLAFMVIMPASGILMSNAGGFPVKFFGLPLPVLLSKSKAAGAFFGGVHGISASLIMLLIVLHVGLVLKRTLVNKDRFILRMITKQ